MHVDLVVEEETDLGFCLYEPQVKHSFGGLETDFFPEVVDWSSKKTRQKTVRQSPHTVKSKNAVAEFQIHVVNLDTQTGNIPSNQCIDMPLQKKLRKCTYGIGN